MRLAKMCEEKADREGEFHLGVLLSVCLADSVFVTSTTLEWIR